MEYCEGGDLASAIKAARSGKVVHTEGAKAVARAIANAEAERSSPLAPGPAAAAAAAAGDAAASGTPASGTGERVSTPFPEKVILRWFAQLVSAVAFTHAHNVLHRDLKSTNIFLKEDGSIRLGDFGISRVSGGPPPPSSSS